MNVALTGATGTHRLPHPRGAADPRTRRDGSRPRQRSGPNRLCPGRHPGCRRSLRSTRRRQGLRRHGRRHTYSQSGGCDPAQTLIPQWSTPRSVHSMAPVSPTCISAACGSTDSNISISESSPFHAPPMVSWKEPIERRVLDAGGLRGVVIVSSVAYGDGGGGVPGLLLGSPRDPAGNLIMLGTGLQHWSTVHVADLADFFRRVFQHDSAQGYYVVGNGLNPSVAELTEAAAVATGASGAVPGLRRGSSRPPRRLLRRGPAAQSRHGPRPGHHLNSVGFPPVRDWWTSSATAVTAADIASPSRRTR